MENNEEEYDCGKIAVPQEIVKNTDMWFAIRPSGQKIEIKEIPLENRKIYIDHTSISHSEILRRYASQKKKEENKRDSNQDATG